MNLLPVANNPAVVTKEGQIMKPTHFIEETPHTRPVLSDEEFVGLGVLCSTIMTLLALLDLARLLWIMG